MSSHTLMCKGSLHYDVYILHCTLGYALTCWGFLGLLYFHADDGIMTLHYTLAYDLT